ncbi:inositol transporter-like SP family MFS transporter [Sphingomonas kyeonggiensis]|uniref:Inositol transporter-like SP family MFS transporter n=1 Tax=Sphingomonas kyeonggiensis TaxID=1268553 RepID=A0A7W7NSG0_9SPHN|nr:MFS transporter [Sphingomonas kyeonggiensis]MBB4839913.1 inositol transporter-like SP family MFS transporter [Sphingomonas kyeonggiensis]
MASTNAQDKDDWRNTILAGLANYIDAGSIVAGSAALALWQEAYHLNNNTVGLIGAFGPNAISAGVGALIGGRLCDLFGRKKIYQYDMLFYAFGMLWLVFAMNAWMVVLGFFLVGLAVGADIPASWSIIAEMAPKGKRGKHSGVAQVLWYLGPVVVLLLFLVLTPLGLLGARIVFAHLALLAIGLTFLRSRMQESPRWLEAQAADEHKQIEPARISALFKPRYLGSMAFLIGMYGMWNLWAGTNGFFFPYILRTVGDASQATAVAIQTLSFLIGMLSIWGVFMQFSDRLNQRTMFLVSAIIQVVGMSLLALFPLTLPLAILHVFLMAFGQGFGAQSFFQLWSSEMFPTLLRSTAQGLMFAVVRIGLGIWSFFVPVLTATGFTTLAWILTGFLAASGIIGMLGAPRNEGKSLEELEAQLKA